MDLINKDFKVVGSFYNIIFTIIKVEDRHYITRKGNKGRTYWDLQDIKDALRDREWELINKIMWI